MKIKFFLKVFSLIFSKVRKNKKQINKNRLIKKYNKVRNCIINTKKSKNQKSFKAFQPRF